MSLEEPSFHVLSPSADTVRELLVAVLWGAGLWGVGYIWWLNAS
jgi:hypothetical protein